MTPSGDRLDLNRTEKRERGRGLVAHRLEQLGATVTPDKDRRSSRLRVRGKTREVEVFVATQPVGGYAMWTKRRLELAKDRYVAVVLLSADEEPELYLVPTLDFVDATPPLTNRDFIGFASEPEYGIELGPAAVQALGRYAWTDESAAKLAR